jgi:hypothetical protein
MAGQQNAKAQASEARDDVCSATNPDEPAQAETDQQARYGQKHKLQIKGLG